MALAARGSAGRPTVLTPHPLEAARLLRCSAGQVQADRLRAARGLADELGATVLLKGSGSVLCAPGQPAWINPTGNARLGSAGTGDVLAGWIGGRWSQQAECRGLDAALASTWLHGAAAEQSPAASRAGLPLRAGGLIDQMVQAAAALASTNTRA